MDLSQFHAGFFEESLELLEEIENILVGLEIESVEAETINTIFRAAHSIKGGSGTFGFTQISQFTHVMETYLDKVRDGERTLTRDAVDILLSSIDCIRGMIEDVKCQQDIDEEVSKELLKKINALIDEDAPTSKEAPKESASQEASDDELQALFDSISSSDEGADSPFAGKEGFFIHFQPKAELLSQGNDPIRIFRELKSMGNLSLYADLSKLPDFQALKPDVCYLSWKLYLETQVTQEHLEENVFDWVLDVCEITFQPLNSITESPAMINLSEEKKESSEEKPEKSAKPPEEKIEEKPVKKPPTLKESASIRVPIEKVDELINMVGELVITQSMLGQLIENFDTNALMSLKQGVVQLEQNSRELQESVMRIRMMPISTAFNRFPRLVRDSSRALGKKVDLKISGESTELDKTVIEKIGDPLVHLVRNSMDHGIEKPEIRKQNGKSETGTIHLNAFHQGGNVIIEIADDGGGLNKDKILAKAEKNGLIHPGEQIADEQIWNLIFHPGFSTADVVSDISGRGVGMDVVKKNIHSLGGGIEIQSKLGEGTKISIRLPLTLAILDGQLLFVGDQIYIIPLLSILETIQIQKKELSFIASKGEVYYLRNEYIPVIRLYELFDLKPRSENLEDSFLVVVELDRRRYGLVIDELSSQQQVVIKNLDENYKSIQGISGATILGDGRVALIIDVSGIVRLASEKSRGKKRVEIAAQGECHGA